MAAPPTSKYVPKDKRFQWSKLNMNSSDQIFSDEMAKNIFLFPEKMASGRNGKSSTGNPVEKARIAPTIRSARVRGRNSYYFKGQL